MKALFALNPYIWRYRKHLLLGILFVLISNLFAVYPAQIVRSSIDMVGDILDFFSLVEGFEIAGELRAVLIRSLILFGGLVVLMAVLRGIFLFFTRQTLIVMSRLIEYNLRSDLYKHLQDMSLSFYRRNRTGDLMARIAEDVPRVRMYLGPGIMYTLNTITLFVVVVTTMLMVNPELTLYALLPLPILSYLIYFVESIIQQRSERIQHQLSRLTSIAQEMFSGIRVVKAYIKERAISQNFSEEAEAYKEKSMNLAKVDAMFFPLIVGLIGMSVILTVWIGGEQVIAGELSIGNIAEFIIYINLLTWPIVAIGWVTTLVQRAAASQVRLNDLLKERSEIAFPKEANYTIESASLKFNDVSFTYPDTGIQALKHVQFKISAGQKLGILGPTGSGKSTLCAVIPRLFDIDDGEIQIDNHPLEVYDQDTLRGAIGYAPQDVFLFSDDIHNNVAFGKPDASREEVEQATRWASIYENIADFPEGFDTLVGERGVTLSGGQKQRISVARAWIRKPKLLILDDVLSAVDTQTEETILQNLRSFKANYPGVSIIMVAHRISCIQDADHIIVLEGGEITQQGNHESLSREEGYYKRIYEKQLSEEQSTMRDRN